jgi:hypothetical protein
MKQILLLGAFFVLSCAAQEADLEMESQTFSHQVEIPTGGNTYTTHPNFQNYISPQGIRPWNTPEVVWDTYVYLEQEGTYHLGIKGLGNTRVSLMLEVGNQENTFEFNPEKAEVQVGGKFKFPKGYSKISLKGNSGNANYPGISGIYLIGNEEIKGSWVKDNEDSRFYWGRRGPSVHLSFTPPAETDIQYYYTELLIPEGEDVVGSYFMANGFAEGYFGIQVNSELERRILFSVWSPYNTDNPGEIPDEYKIKLLDKGVGVYTGEFGNEGSGGQSYMLYPWKAGLTYCFLTRAVPDDSGNTTFTSYFREGETGEWHLIASFLRPKTQTWYTRPHAFLENFIDHNGYLGRRVQYANPWVYTTTGEWIPLTEARFTTDDIGNREYRKDLSGGIDSGRFYLRNGGFFNDSVEPNTFFSLPAYGSAPQINFQSLQGN